MLINTNTNTKSANVMINELLVRLFSVARLPVVWFAVLGTFGLSMVFEGVDRITDPSRYQPTAMTSSNPASIEEQIRQGADPTTLLPATATGGSQALGPQCSRGRLITSGSLASYNGLPYISSEFETVKYGQIQTIPPIFFVQYDHQSVTFTAIDRLPPDASNALQEAMRRLSDCRQQTLHIEAMLSSDYLRSRDS